MIRGQTSDMRSSGMRATGNRQKEIAKLQANVAKIERQLLDAINMSAPQTTIAKLQRKYNAASEKVNNLYSSEW